jgi:hypothetical protein
VNTTAPELAGIVISGLSPAPIPPKEPNLLERLANWIFNLARRPLVSLRLREVAEIGRRVRADALGALNASLTASGATCPICRFNSTNLNGCVFTSQFERLVTSGKCGHHPGAYVEFEAKHRDDFDRSEKLSRWINGF